jgi:hypothetical protein
MQQIGYSNKTYSFFKQLPEMAVKRKGHLLHNPSAEQIAETEYEYLRKAKINQWSIENNIYISSWKQRPLDIIDTIIVGATDAPSWNSKTLYDFDTSIKNNVTPDIPLPGISYHIFINASGIIERVAVYTDLISHTKGNNARSIGIVIQYGISNNSAEPSKKILAALEKTLAILCLQFKLNPYKAIKGQGEAISGIKSPVFSMFSKGHKGTEHVSPGLLVSMDEIRRRVAIMVKRKIQYAESVSGPIKPEFDSNTMKLMNRFNSTAVSRLYSNSTNIIRLYSNNAIYKR